MVWCCLALFVDFLAHKKIKIAINEFFLIESWPYITHPDRKMQIRNRIIKEEIFLKNFSNKFLYQGIDGSDPEIYESLRFVFFFF